MKLNKLIMAGVAALSFLALTVGNVKAVFVPSVTNSVSINATAVAQSGTNNNGTITTVSSTKISVNTKQILQWLALDEFAEGNFPSNSFPKGAQLVLINGNGSDFQVLDKNGNPLVDVNDLLSIDHGDRTVVTAKISDVTGLYSPSASQTRLFDFSYDDGGIDNGVHLRFDVEGQETITLSDSPVKAGAYTQSISVSVSPMVGDGTYQGIPFVITGSLSFSGKQTLGFL
jgi:hypothetical protein